jgi:hypothetical protein
LIIGKHCVRGFAFVKGGAKCRPLRRLQNRFWRDFADRDIRQTGLYLVVAEAEGAALAFA